MQDFKAAMADLADIATKWQRAALVPEKDADLMPVLARLFDAAIRIVGTDLKAATRWVKDQLRANPANQEAGQQGRADELPQGGRAGAGAMSEPPAQGGCSTARSRPARRCRATCSVCPRRGLCAVERGRKAAFDRRQGIRASDRGRVSAANYDTARDNYSPPAVESFMPRRRWRRPTR